MRRLQKDMILRSADDVVAWFERLNPTDQTDVVIATIERLLAEGRVSKVAKRAAKALALKARYELSQNDIAEVLSVGPAQITRAKQRAETVLEAELLIFGIRRFWESIALCVPNPKG